jgi:hypothetical protein
MTKKGCTFNGGKCHEVVDKCEGCDRIVTLEEGKFCAALPNPEVKWKMGSCNMATHVKSAAKNGTNVKINPLKASKRSMRK